MPQSEVNAPAHLHEREIKENLNYRVLKACDYFYVFLYFNLFLFQVLTAI